jgi:hypothetical protein
MILAKSVCIEVPMFPDLPEQFLAIGDELMCRDNVLRSAAAARVSVGVCPRARDVVCKAGGTLRTRWLRMSVNIAWRSSTAVEGPRRIRARGPGADTEVSSLTQKIHSGTDF